MFPLGLCQKIMKGLPDKLNRGLVVQVAVTSYANPIGIGHHSPFTSCLSALFCKTPPLYASTSDARGCPHLLYNLLEVAVFPVVYLSGIGYALLGWSSGKTTGIKANNMKRPHLQSGG